MKVTALAISFFMAFLGSQLRGVYLKLSFIAWLLPAALNKSVVVEKIIQEQKELYQVLVWKKAILKIFQQTETSNRSFNRAKRYKSFIESLRRNAVFK